MIAPPTQPGRILTRVADDWGAHVSATLTGDAVHARHDAVHRIAAANPAMPHSRVATAVCLTAVDRILHTDPPTPPAPAPDGPVDDGICTLDGCDRRHRSAGLRLCSGHIARWRRHGDLRHDTPLRPVNQTGPSLDLAVHDRAGYRNGCRCNSCRRDGVRAVARNRLRPQTRPLSGGLAALARLTDAGMSIPQVAAVAGVGSACLYSWRNATVATCRQATIDKLDAVEPPARPCEDCGAPSMAHGRWCKPCFDARTLPTTLRQLDDARRRQHARRRRRRDRRGAA